MKFSVLVLALSAIALSVGALVPAQIQSKVVTDQQLADNLMDEVEGILSEMPTDGRVGASRVDGAIHKRTFRDKQSHSKAAAAYQALSKRQAFGIVTFGEIGPKGPAQRVREADYVMVYELAMRKIDWRSKFNETVRGLALKSADLARSGKSSFRMDGPILFPPNRSIIEARVIRAKAPCLSCHKNVKPGGVVGVAAIVRSARS
jgi:hypothetical protein